MLYELSDLSTPWCVHVAATLGVADQIAAGVDRIGPLAAAVGCDAYVLHRLLRHLAGKGVFEEPEPGRFVLNEGAREFLDPGVRLGLDLEGLGGRMAHAWSTMLRYVRTGKAAYAELFGRPFWEDLEANPEIDAQFDALMGVAGHGEPNPEFEITGGWDGVRLVVDTGGGSGAMLAGILRARPRVRGILVDRPATVARSAEVFRAAGVLDRVTMRGQSFFDPLPRGGDLYLLRGVLNDWQDREAAAILRRCAEAAAPNGRVVVLKSVHPDGERRGITIEMVLLGGRHRTISEFRELVRGCGLEVAAAGEQPSGYFVVECRTVEGVAG